MICISINHKNSITEMRERFALSDEEKEQFFRMAGAQGLDGCVLLMTCNRCEIYISGSNEIYHAVEGFFQKQKGHHARRILEIRDALRKEGSSKTPVSSGLRS